MRSFGPPRGVLQALRVGNGITRLETYLKSRKNYKGLITLPQKESGKKGLAKSDEKGDEKSVRKSDQHVTKHEKGDRTPFADLLLQHPDLTAIRMVFGLAIRIVRF